MVNTGAKHVVFIRCLEEVDPCQLVHHMLSDIATSGVRKSRLESCEHHVVYVVFGGRRIVEILQIKRGYKKLTKSYLKRYCQPLLTLKVHAGCIGNNGKS